MDMDINLHHLRVFHAVAGQRSFSKAAAALFISQPAVSKAIRELERQLDIPLIERGKSGRGMRLTEIGQALFDHASGIFALERAATEDIRARKGLARGNLTVGASTTIVSYWLPAYVAQFCREFPAIRLEVRVGNTTEISRELIECSIDIALVEGSVDDARIHVAPWREDELRIVVHPESALLKARKLDSERLSDEVWLLRETGSGTRDACERMLQAHGIRPARTLEIGSNEGIARSVAAGAGIALLPLRVVREMLMLGEVKAVRYPRGETLSRPLFLLQLKERPPSPLVQAFRAVLARPLESPVVRR